MFIRFVVLISLCGLLSLKAQNYADSILEQLGQKAEALSGHEHALEKLLLAEQIYYLGHETAAQEIIAQRIEELLESSRHQELRAELGFFLTQQWRQLGAYGKIEKLIKSLGYVDQWQVLGPLMPQDQLEPKQWFTGKKVKGMNAPVEPWVVRAHGKQDYWRGGIGHYGLFSADHAIYPNQLAGALFSTWFYAPEKGSYRLGLGWSNRLAVWINRSMLFEGLENQKPHPDQKVLDFKLKKGWHRLTLYVESASENPNLGFFARMTDAEGMPLSYSAEEKKGFPKARPKLLVEAQPSLTGLAAELGNYALASTLLIKEQTQNKHYDHPKILLAKALENDPQRVIIEKWLTLVGEPNQRWQIISAFLKRVSDTDGHHLDRAWALTNLGQIALGQERFWEARKYAEEAVKAHPGYWPAEILENNGFSGLGLFGEALRKTENLAERHPDVPWIMMDLSDLYWSMNFWKENRSQLEHILSVRRSNTKFAERKIQMLKSQGESEKLEGFYALLLKDAPYSVQIALSYGQFLSANQKFAAAENLLQEYLEQLPRNPFLLEGMGELLLRQGKKEALPYLEEALALRPQNPKLEKLIALQKSELGAFYEPYRLTEIPDVDHREYSDIGINLHNTVTKVAPNGQSSVYSQIEYEIITEQGARELPGYSFSYAPLRQNAEILKAEIYRGDRIILLTKFGKSRISDPAYRMYYDLVAYQIQFPTLKVGDRIRVEYRVDDTYSTNIYGNYFGDLHYFSEEYPIRKMSYTLIMPKDRPIYYHVEKMEPHFVHEVKDDQTVFTWSKQQLMAYETESRMPGLAGYLPYVGVSTFENWGQVAQWYKGLIKEQLNLDLETKKIVEKLIEGLSDPLDIVKKIHEFVITHTRYVALEFGIHGYKPYQVNKVCSRQFGDCKDKASLIVSMLREAGIEASIVITRTADLGEVNTYPPMLSYFNHAIAYVPQFDLYLDGTAEFSGIKELPAMDQGALVLVIDEKGRGSLKTTPIIGENLQGFDFELEFNAKGEAQVRGKVSYTGVSTPDVRQYLSIGAKLSQNLKELLADKVPGLNVIEANREGMRINEPITLKFRGTSNQLFQTHGTVLTLPMSILSEQLTQAYAPNAKRKFPIDIGVPKIKRVSVAVGVPAGYKVGRLPDTLEVEDDNFKVHIKFEQSQPDQCRIDYLIAFKSARVGPQDYESLRNLMQAHDRVLDQAIHFVVQ